MPLNLLDQESRDYAIRTLFGEAGSDPGSQHGVAAVIKNRATQSGKSVKDVVTAKGQFEPWMTEEGRKRLMGLDPASEAYKNLGTVIDNIWSGATEDPTHGATMFIAPEAQKAAGRNIPSWAKGPGITLGAQQFFGGAFPEPKAGEAVATALPAIPGTSAVTPTVVSPPQGSPPEITNPFTNASKFSSPLPPEEASSTRLPSLFAPGEGQERILKSFEDAGMTPQQLAMIAQMMKQMV